MADQQFEYPHFKTRNTVQQDLFWLAKGHYKVKKLDRITAIKLVLSAHVIAFEFLQLRDVIHWLMSEFYEKGVVFTRPSDITRLVVNPGSIHCYGPTRPSFQELVIHEIMDAISTKQVYQGDEYLLNFDKGDPDPQIQEFLEAYERWRDEAAQTFSAETTP